MNTSTIVLIASIAAVFSAMAAIISAVAAIASAIIGPIVSSRIAMRQIRASTASAGRQKWLDEIKDKLSELLGNIFLLAFRTQTKVCRSDVNTINEILKLKSYIDLMLYADNYDNNELREAIHNCVYKLLHEIDKPFDVGELRKLLSIIEKRGLNVVQKEWNLIKEGK